MKTNKTTRPVAMLVAVVAAGALNAFADDQSTQATQANGPEQKYSGQVVSINPQEQTLRVKSWWLSTREFNLGNNCTYALVGINPGTAANLQPGEKITVRYQDSHGVRIADRVEEQPTRLEGMVTAIDPGRRTMTVRQGGFDRPMQIASGCSVTLRNDQSGMLTDIRPGNHVMLVCDTPNGALTARQIAQTSLAFSGKLTAIDLGEKTVKAQGAFDTKKFNLADNCAIVINGKTDGQLSDLKPDERLVFSYDTVNGVNVVNRIAPAATEPQNNSMLTTTPGYSGYPVGY